MWVIHACLAVTGSCDPRSWADLLEMLAAFALILGGVWSLFLFILWLGA